jgi:murein DD-endopeptidase MepM/ murein hydrolase activator NlpD
MSFVMIAAGRNGRRGVRTLSLGQIVAGGAVAAVALMAVGTAVGYWLAEPPPAASLIADVKQVDPNPVALAQFGAISGRLFRLESQAAQLSKRIGVKVKDDNADKPPAKKPGSGGPMLPPRAAADSAGVIDLALLEAQLATVEQQITRLAEAAALLNLDVMRLPSRAPIADAELGSSFGNRRDPFTGRPAFHAGLDFAADAGTEILSAAGGEVVFAGYRPDYGWSVDIEHGNGLTTRYAHASRLLVKRGAIVAPGEPIALVGSTGRSTGPHLHFEVLRRGEAVDPKKYLVARP